MKFFLKPVLVGGYLLSMFSQKKLLNSSYSASIRLRQKVLRQLYVSYYISMKRNHHFVLPLAAVSDDTFVFPKLKSV